MRSGAPREYESSSSRDQPSYTTSPGASDRGPDSAGISSADIAARLAEEWSLRERDLSEADALNDLPVSEPPEGDTERTADATDVPGADRASEPPGERRGRIEASEVRGILIGSGNRQENLYIWTVEMPPIDLAERLKSADVRTAVQALAADPADSVARQHLLSKIAPEHWLSAPTTKLQVAQLGRPGVSTSDSPLGTLFLRVSGLQVGDGNIQRNEFTYAVAPTADAADLLRAHPKLAKALIDCAFPDEGSGDVATVNAALRDALEHAKVVPNDNIGRTEHREMPGPGEVLRLRNIDGVSVGSGSSQQREDEIKVDGVTAVTPEHVGTSDPWASAASPE